MEPSLDLLDRLGRAEPNARVFDKLQRRIAYRERAARRWWMAAAASVLVLLGGEAYLLLGPSYDDVADAEQEIAQLVPTLDNAFVYD